MMHRFGFFDVDNRELDETGRAWTYRPRVQPIVPQLEQLYALAEAQRFPLVITTCCSGRMLARAHAFPDTLFVPLDAADGSWRAQLRDYRRFYLAKAAFGDSQANAAGRAFDMFQHNANAGFLLRELGVETWVVFGNGFEKCVGSAAAGILGAGLPLIVLEDVRISNKHATPESEQAAIRTWRDRGARVMTLDTFVPLAERS
jgi:hypothetical protein